LSAVLRVCWIAFSTVSLRFGARTFTWFISHYFSRPFKALSFVVAALFAKGRFQGVRKVIFYDVQSFISDVVLLGGGVQRKQLAKS